MPVMRCASEPPENLGVNQKTGLRGGFPIKIAGHALGSQESLAGRRPERGLFGQRIGLRRNSEAPFRLAQESPGERRRSLRGSTPIRSNDNKYEAPRDSSPFVSQFGNGSRRKSIGGIMSNGPLSSTENHQENLSKNIPLKTSNGFNNVNNEQSRSKVEDINCSNIQKDSGHKVNRNSTGNRQFSGHSKNDGNCLLQNDLDHEIKRMSDRITAFKMDTGFTDVEVETQFDTELQSMKDNLEELNLEKEAVETSNSLDDVITKMKNSLKAIKDGVNQKTLIDLNREVTPLDLPPLREMTPLDLPALSPLPPMMMRRRRVTKKEQLPNKTQVGNLMSNPQTESVDKCLPGLIVNDSQKQETAWNIVNRDTDPQNDGQGQSNNEEVESSLSSCSITVQLVKHPDLGKENTESDLFISAPDIIISEFKNKDEEAIEGYVNNVTNCENITIEKHDNTANDSKFVNETIPSNEVHDHEKEINSSESTYLFLSDDSSVCSTPTVLERRKEGCGYESDSSVYPETDCEDIYESFKVNIGNVCVISDIESEEEEEWRENTPKVKQKDGEIPQVEIMMDRSMKLPLFNAKIRPEEPKTQTERSRRQSGRRKSMSSDKTMAKKRYCWRCHQAGHENWECQEDSQPVEWCARCLETSHWEDACWVEAAHVLCPVCSVPGHLPCVHEATDFRQRKLIIDTFGWLSFKDWFQDLTFRNWWNCSGFTGVPLYKIMMRNNSKDLDLGFDD